jgi:hypothetical protein
VDAGALHAARYVGPGAFTVVYLRGGRRRAARCALRWARRPSPVSSEIGGKALGVLAYNTLKSFAWHCCVSFAPRSVSYWAACLLPAWSARHVRHRRLGMCVQLFNSLLLSRLVLLRLLSQPPVIFATANLAVMAVAAAFVYDDPATSIVFILCSIAHAPSHFIDAGPSLKNKHTQWGVYSMFAEAFMIFTLFATFSDAFPAMQTRMYVLAQRGQDSASSLFWPPCRTRSRFSTPT